MFNYKEARKTFISSLSNKYRILLSIAKRDHSNTIKDIIKPYTIKSFSVTNQYKNLSNPSDSYKTNKSTQHQPSNNLYKLKFTSIKNTKPETIKKDFVNNGLHSIISSNSIKLNKKIDNLD